jgi:hypothetical protein
MIRPVLMVPVLLLAFVALIASPANAADNRVGTGYGTTGTGPGSLPPLGAPVPPPPGFNGRRPELQHRRRAGDRDGTELRARLRRLQRHAVQPGSGGERRRLDPGRGHQPEQRDLAQHAHPALICRRAVPAYHRGIPAPPPHCPDRQT